MFNKFYIVAEKQNIISLADESRLTCPCPLTEQLGNSSQLNILLTKDYLTNKIEGRI